MMPAGSRDYTWEVDTLANWPNSHYMVYRIWGSSPSDVWVGGDMGSAPYSIWHYDGRKWTAIRTPLLTSTWGIHGFSQDNVWMVEAGSNIWHFDGVEWSIFGTYPYKDYKYVGFNRLHGVSPNELYAVGFAETPGEKYTRIILKYDGNDWSYINIPEKDQFFASVVVEESSKHVYLQAEKNVRGVGFFKTYYRLVDDSLIPIDSTSKMADLVSLNGNALAVINNEIYDFQNDKLVLWKQFDESQFIGRIWGRNRNDFFTYNYFGNVGHYNGYDLKNIFSDGENRGLVEGFVFDRDVFFIVMELDLFQFYIYHGSLK